MELLGYRIERRHKPAALICALLKDKLLRPSDSEVSVPSGCGADYETGESFHLLLRCATQGVKRLVRDESPTITEVGAKSSHVRVSQNYSRVSLKFYGVSHHHRPRHLRKVSKVTCDPEIV